MEIPIYLNGGEAGRLTIGKQAGRIVLTARMRDAGRIVRLKLYGRGEPFYLGVPMPEAEGLCLVRRLTPTEAKRLPDAPAYAAETELEKPRHVIYFGGRAHYF